MRNRNTYFRGFYNSREQLVVCQKVVYSEIEFEHRYEYHDSGFLKTAVIREADEEPRILRFNDVEKVLAD